LIAKPDLKELAEIQIKSLEESGTRIALLELTDKVKRVWEWIDYSFGYIEETLGIDLEDINSELSEETANIYSQIDSINSEIDGIDTTLSTCWKNGDTLSGKGTLPLGAIIAIHDGASNVSIPASGTINSDGFQFCDGVALGSGHGLTGMTNVPNLTDSRFLMGTTLAGTSGSSGGGSVTLATANLPSHTHTITHTHSITHDHASANSGGPSNTHFHATNPPSATTGNASGTVSGYFEMTDDNSTSMKVRVKSASTAFSSSSYTASHINSNGVPSSVSLPNRVNINVGSHTHSINLPSTNSGAGIKTGTTSTTDAHYHALNLPSFSGTSGGSSSANTGSTGSGSSFSVVPKYLTVKYVMRVI
jgi:hypothetical protein